MNSAAAVELRLEAVRARGRAGLQGDEDPEREESGEQEGEEDFQAGKKERGATVVFRKDQSLRGIGHLFGKAF